jgi:hypothetical protein
MSEARSHLMGKSGDVSAFKASRKGAGPASGSPLSARSRDVSPRPVSTGKPAAVARRSPVPSPRRTRSRDASTTGLAARPVEARRRGAGPLAGSRDASRRSAGLEPAAGARKPRSCDASAIPARVRSRDASPTATRGRAQTSKRAGFICPPCGRFVPTEVDGIVLRAGTGSPPRFCSPGCRQAAYRRRQAGVAEDVALQLRGGRDRSLAGRKEAGND